MSSTAPEFVCPMPDDICPRNPQLGERLIVLETQVEAMQRALDHQSSSDAIISASLHDLQEKLARLEGRMAGYLAAASILASGLSLVIQRVLR